MLMLCLRTNSIVGCCTSFNSSGPSVSDRPTTTFRRTDYRTLTVIAVALLLTGSIGSTVGAATAKAANGPGASETRLPSAKKPMPMPKPASTQKVPVNSATTAKPKRTAGSTAENPVSVRFDSPGAKPRPINETTINVTKPVAKLSMNVTGVTYRGLVCGFSFRGLAPNGPVTIRMRGTSPVTTFDSGALSVSWSGLDSDLVKSDSGANGGWSFSSEAHVNRNGPGWVISLGGVTPEAPNAIPKTATCELVSGEPITSANGPIGYWAGFATV